jgi:hypothetical protein
VIHVGECRKASGEVDNDKENEMKRSSANLADQAYASHFDEGIHHFL